MKDDLVKLHHARSQRDFPHLKLEDDEYVDLAIRRSSVGVVIIWASVIIAFIVLTVLIIIVSTINSASAVPLNDSAQFYLYCILAMLYVVILFCGGVGTYVYTANKLYVTNHRIIQETTTSLFTKSVHVIELVSIEDVSFKQQGIFDQILRIGTIRMTTITNDSSYTFKYVDTPTDEMETISHLVHVEKEQRGTLK